MIDEHRRSRAGLIFGLAAYTLWGFLPLYFKLLTAVSPTEIVAHRIIWSLVFLAGLVTLWRRWPAIRAAVGSARVMAILIVTSALIAANWLIFIWAVVRGHACTLRLRALPSPGSRFWGRLLNPPSARHAGHFAL